MRAPMPVAVFLLVSTLVSSPLLALSIFDILQLTEKGYESEEIISLIEATDSMFELEAEDLPKLKELGVDEAVVRAMLERVPAERPGGLPGERPGEPPPPAPDSGSHPDDEHDHAPRAPERRDERDREAGSDYEGDYSEAWRNPAPRGETQNLGSPETSFAPASPEIVATPPLVSYFDVEEERSGGHQHAAIAVSGVEVLILRDEGGFSSIEARAREIVRRLDDSWALGDGTFYRDARDSGPIVVFQGAAARQRITVIEVTAADARAYERRSGREVSRGLLASYWADLLSDFGALAMGRAPNRTTSLHSGEALGVLYQALRSSRGKGGGLRTAADLMPGSTRHHLESLALAVPVDYEL